MIEKKYRLYEEYMLLFTGDSAHDREHIYRVLAAALDIAGFESNVDKDILVVSCLLHDIGRMEEYENPRLCHAQIGSEKAYQFLLEQGWNPDRAARVCRCISQHRYRNDNRPDSIEAKILFDADKLDVTGAIGIARTLMYNGHISEPIYRRNDDGTVSDGSNDIMPSFFREYKRKLEKLYDNFYTGRGKEMAKLRKTTAELFYNSLLEEIQMITEN